MKQYERLFKDADEFVAVGNPGAAVRSLTCAHSAASTRGQRCIEAKLADLGLTQMVCTFNGCLVAA